MKKRTVAIVVWLVSAVIALAVGVVALSQECGHNWDNMVVIETVEATCTAEGSETRECSRCKERETKSLEKLEGHEKYHSVKVKKEATCMQEGIKTIKCSKCKIEWVEDIERVDHDYSVEAEKKEPTCTEAGYIRYKCVYCGKKGAKNEVVSALGHDYVEDEAQYVAPTCLQSGFKVFNCSRCGASKTETVDALVHSYNVYVEPNEVATCEKASHTGYHKCEYCGCADPEEYANAVITPAHLRDDGWEIYSESSCTEHGYEVQKCPEVSCAHYQREYQRPLPLSPHDYIHVKQKDATCMEAGHTEYDVCEYCGDIRGKKAIIEKLSHEFNDDGHCVIEYKDENNETFTCGTYTYIFTLNKDGKSYTLAGINKNSVSENRTVFNIPATYQPSEESDELPITAIGDRVFSNLSYIEEITISENITVIGKSAFEGCVALEKLTVRSSETRNVAVSKVVNVGEDAFKGCIKLAEFDFASLVEIGESAFERTAFVEIVLTDKVTSIGASAFGATSKLESITVPYIGLTKDDDNVFGVIFGSTNDDVPQSLKEVIVLSVENVTILVGGAFESIQSLTKIKLPANYDTFGESAFENCTALTEIYVGENLNDFSKKGKDKKTIILGADMLKGTQLNSIVLPYLGNGRDITNLGYLYGGENKMVASSLKTVSLPTITVIADNAFKGCSSIVTVAIEKVTSIGADAFNGCTALKNIVTEEKNKKGVYLDTEVVSIGFGAFVGCTSIETLTVPFLGKESTVLSGRNLGYLFGATSNESLENIKFSLKKVVVLECNDDKLLDASAFAHFSSVEEIVIPAVAEIGNEAFINCKALSSINLESVEKIGESAFVGCENLESVSLKNIKDIGKSAFAECEKLSVIDSLVDVVTIGESAFFKTAITSVGLNKAKTIGSTAFKDCTALKTVEIEYIEGIGERAFENCSSISEMVLPFIGEKLDGDNEFGYIFGGNDKLPTSLKNVTITAGTLVRASAFADCTSIQNITLPEGIKEVGEQAFSGCTALKEVTFQVAEGTDGALDTIETKAFYNCSALTEIHLPNSTKKIKEAAFVGCRNIQSMTLPFLGYSLDGMGVGTNTVHFGYIFGEDVSTTDQCDYVPNNKNGLELTLTKAMSITAQAFKGCEFITKITLPVTVTDIGSEAFSGCSSLTEVVFDGVEGDNFDKWDVSAIKSNTFDGCSKLQTLILPKSVETIENGAFAKCSNLSTFRTATNSTTKKNVLDVVTIGDQAFQDAFAKEKTLELKNVSTVGERAFRRVRLSSVTFDDSCSLENFSTFVFENSTYVKKVKLPGELRKINIGTFWACTNLTSFEMPSNIQEICASAFYGCTALTISGKDYNNDGRADNVLEFTNAITIGEKAFYECINLEEVIFNSSNTYYTNNHPNTTIGKHAFAKCSGLIRVYLKAWYYEAGSDDAGNNYWLEEGVAVIESLAFSGAGGKNGKILTVCGDGVFGSKVPGDKNPGDQDPSGTPGDGSAWDGGWSDDFLQGAKVPNGKTYNGNVSYEEYLAYRTYCVEEKKGYATWAEYQEYLSSQSQNL